MQKNDDRNMYDEDLQNDIEICFKEFDSWDYSDILNLQTRYFNELVQNKIKSENRIMYCLYGEHNSVITTGVHANNKNILFSEDLLKENGIDFYKINRGGDVTLHSPGQIVFYPVFDLDTLEIGIKEYIYRLEEVVIRTLDVFGIKGERIDGAVGVWLDKNSSKERKICAIGVKASRYITMHGFALNVNNDLELFKYINPCGFTDKEVTSVKKETGKEVSLTHIQQLLKENMRNLFLYKK